VDREKATAREDLPHAFQETLPGSCEVCGAPSLDARHLEWERAAEGALAPHEYLPRELGA
jgi:hypothetical protein